MPRRALTSGRKFSTTTSARATSRLRISRPSGALRSSVIERLFRWRFWASKPRREKSPSMSSRAATWTTLAPMSASCRTQVGPDLARVRSMTVYGARGSVIALLPRSRGLETDECARLGDAAVPQIELRSERGLRPQVLQAAAPEGLLARVTVHEVHVLVARAQGVEVSGEPRIGGVALEMREEQPPMSQDLRRQVQLGRVHRSFASKIMPPAVKKSKPDPRFAGWPRH